MHEKKQRSGGLAIPQNLTTFQSNQEIGLKPQLAFNRHENCEAFISFYIRLKLWLLE